jgi:Patatin-like phospholipase
VPGLGLVLGGGGPVGIGWYAGLLLGLSDAGVDLNRADVVLGTSAGAVAGAWLTSGLPIADFAENLLHQDPNPPFLGADERLLAQIYALIRAADAPLEPEDAREIGRLAIEAPTPAVRNWARCLPDTAWPKRLRAVVVNAEDGRVRMITQSDGIPLALGVAASCAAPGNTSCTSTGERGPTPTQTYLLAWTSLALSSFRPFRGQRSESAKACIAYCKRRCAAFTRQESTRSRFCPRRSRTMPSEQISSPSQRSLLRLRQVDVEAIRRRAASAN